MELTVISTTKEAVYGEWIYHFEENSAGTLVRRTPLPVTGRPPIWYHGVIVQIYDSIAGRFVPSIKYNIGAKRFASTQEAIETITLTKA